MMLGHFRITQGLQTRRPEERPEKLPFVINHPDGKQQIIELSADEYPIVYYAPTYFEPGILTGAPPTENFLFQPFLTFNENDATKAIPKGSGFQVGKIEALEFARMLAKIAHSYAAAEIGLKNFLPLLPNLILGKTKTAGHWVGSEKEIAPKEKFAHKIMAFNEIVGDKNYLMATVRLFPFFGTPTYRIVIGELSKGSKVSTTDYPLDS